LANTRELRRRIRSVKNTAQITKAMQMVAATKMRKAQTQALAGRPYGEALTLSLADLFIDSTNLSHPFLNQPESGLTGVILLSTDKSLCGALNTNLFRFIQNFQKDKAIYYTIGKKGRQYVARTNKDLEADFENPEQVTFKQATQLSKLAIQDFLSGKLKEVYVIYPQFVSALRQEPKALKILPIAVEIPEKQELSKIELFEPDKTKLLDFILTHFIEMALYQSLLETKASEHSARMMAMQNATDNAKELVQDLQLAYNQTRQDSITKELLEITSATAALE
jgi:F-type H+-transporting ATPase subunit gamma